MRTVFYTFLLCADHLTLIDRSLHDQFFLYLRLVEPLKNKNKQQHNLKSNHCVCVCARTFHIKFYNRKMLNDIHSICISDDKIRDMLKSGKKMKKKNSRDISYESPMHQSPKSDACGLKPLNNGVSRNQKTRRSAKRNRGVYDDNLRVRSIK